MSTVKRTSDHMFVSLCVFGGFVQVSLMPRVGMETGVLVSQRVKCQIVATHHCDSSQGEL